MSTIQELANTPQEHFDLEAEYDQHIAPLVEALMAKAAELGVPIQLAAAYKANGAGVGVVSAAQFISSGRAPPTLRAGFHCARNEPKLMMNLLDAHHSRIQKRTRH